MEKTEEKKEESKKKDENVMMIYFDPGHYTVMENVGKFTVTVCRDGDLSHPIEVDFNTEDGTANDGSDYEGYNGTLTFHAGEAHKSVSIFISVYSLSLSFLSMIFHLFTLFSLSIFFLYAYSIPSSSFISNFHLRSPYYSCSFIHSLPPLYCWPLL